jgi:hypothetical protein
MTPRLLPSGLISLTSRARIRLFTRYSELIDYLTVEIKMTKQQNNPASLPDSNQIIAQGLRGGNTVKEMRMATIVGED